MEPAQPLKSRRIRGENDDDDLAELRDGGVLSHTDRPARRCDLAVHEHPRQRRAVEDCAVDFYRIGRRFAQIIGGGVPTSAASLQASVVAAEAHGRKQPVRAR